MRHQESVEVRRRSHRLRVSKALGGFAGTEMQSSASTVAFPNLDVNPRALDPTQGGRDGELAAESPRRELSIACLSLPVRHVCSVGGHGAIAPLHSSLRRAIEEECRVTGVLRQADGHADRLVRRALTQTVTRVIITVGRQSLVGHWTTGRLDQHTDSAGRTRMQ